MQVKARSDSLYSYLALPRIAVYFPCLTYFFFLLITPYIKKKTPCFDWSKQISRLSSSQCEFATILVPPGYLSKHLPCLPSAAEYLHFLICLFYPRVSFRPNFDEVSRFCCILIKNTLPDENDGVSCP